MKTVQEIQQQYGMECAKLGDMVYKYEKLGEEIEKTKLSLHNINVEAFKLEQKIKTEAAPQETPVAPV